MNYEIKNLRIAQGEGYRSMGNHPYRVNASLTGTDSPFGIAEVSIYIDQLIRKYGPAPEGLSFIVLRVDGQFGTEVKAAIQFADCSNKMDRYITKLEKGLKKWDQRALKKLRRIKHPLYIKNKPS